MKLVVCKKCGGDFSKSRPTCPVCDAGNPVAQHLPKSFLLFVAVMVMVLMWGMATKSYIEMFGFFILGFLVLAVVEFRAKSLRYKDMEQQLGELVGFKASQKVIGVDGKFGLAIDEVAQKVCLIDVRYEIPEFRVFPCKDIVSCELFQDGSTITKTVRSSQVGGALVGGLALGGVGALIGGLSAKKKSTDSVNRIDLRMVVYDIKKPVHDVSFLNFETNKDGVLDGVYYDQCLKRARHWHALIEILIRRADIDENRANSMIKKDARGAWLMSSRSLRN